MDEVLQYRLLSLGPLKVTVEALLLAILIVVGTFVVARLLRSWLSRLRRRSGAATNSTLYIAERISFYAIFLIGLIGALSALGLDFSSLTLFAGALGVGIGLGLQAVVRNFFSGVTLLLDRSLGPGDFIELEDGLTGEVLEVGSSATRLVTNDNVDVMVPNAHLLDTRLVNWTRGGATRRVHVPFMAAFGCDKDLVRRVVIEAAQSIPFTLPDEGARGTQVWLTGFGEHGLKFELVVWPALGAVKRPGAMHAAYTWAIEDALRSHGVEIPFPQLDLRLRSMFGREGEAGLDALGRSAPARSPSANDAASDIQHSPTPLEERRAAGLSRGAKP